MPRLFSYLVIINLLTFIIRGVDKRKSVKKKRRVSERQLLWLVLAGGVLGALAGQSLFRHKTIKSSFLWKFRLCAAVRGVIISIAAWYR